VLELAEALAYLITEVATLRERINGVILVYGSAALVEGLIEHDLVDELRLTV
jgi:dihydrofolate reductase